MAICATEMLKQGKLHHNTLVATVMSNMGLDITIKKAGGKLIRTAVGDRYVVEEMLRGGYNLGGEQSGHLIFLDYNTTGDGIQSALQVLAIMRKREKTLSELAQIMEPLPQVLVNVRVSEKKDIKTIPEVATLIKGIEQSMNDEGRVLVRYSGTEPLLRIMLEGADQGQITVWANEIADLVGSKIGEK
jgi:phosphoglucosamine mutase